jgi:hypothetical protein
MISTQGKTFGINSRTAQSAGLKSLDRKEGFLIMHPDTRKVAAHMKEFGLNLMGRAIYDATFSEMCRPFAYASTVTIAAQAAEILIKARISQEHPLLIFSKLPSLLNTKELLKLSDLFGSGRSYTYEELPNVLWATTGIQICNIEVYRSFGRLRNNIMHFAVPDRELSKETLTFCMTVMEPLLEAFWDETAIPYAEEWDESILSDGYLQEQIICNNISLTPKSEAALKHGQVG